MDRKKLNASRKRRAQTPPQDWPDGHHHSVWRGDLVCGPRALIGSNQHAPKIDRCPASAARLAAEAISRAAT